MKKLLAIILAVVLVLSLAACGGNDEPEVTEAPATEEVTAEPTEEVTEAPATPTPEPTEKIVLEALEMPEGMDAIVTEFVTNDESIVIDDAGNDCTVNNGEPWLTITRDGDNGYVIIPFIQDEEMFAFTATDYPIISMYYRITYGASFNPGNNAFPYEVDGESEGLRVDVGNQSCEDFVTDDGDWHQIDLDITDTIDTIVSWGGIRVPLISTQGARLSLAYVGAFKTAEDAAAYKDAYVAMYGDLLVTDEPEDTKEEVVPEEIVDEFDEEIFDFNEFTIDDGLSILDDYEVWQRATGFAQTTFVEKAEGDTVLRLMGDSICTDMVKEGTAYTLEFDVYHPSDEKHFAGVVLNWGDEGNTGRDFFEDNGVFKAGQGAIVSDSGVGLFFTTEDKVRIYVMAYENGKRTAITADISTGFNFANEEKEYAHIKITDDANGVISFYCNDTLFATVEYSDAKVPGSKVVGYSEQYFTKATIKDATGTELATTENALISIYKDVAFGSRVNEIFLDNLKITQG